MEFSAAKHALMASSENPAARLANPALTPAAYAQETKSANAANAETASCFRRLHVSPVAQPVNSSRTLSVLPAAPTAILALVLQSARSVQRLTSF